MFDRKLIADKIWSNLPLPSKSVYLVIGVYCDKTGIAYPSQLTIGILCDMFPKTVTQDQITL